MTCEYRSTSGTPRCSLAERWSELPVVSVTDDACKVCLSSTRPKSLNRVVVSISIAQARNINPQLVQPLLERGRPYLVEPGFIEKVNRYVSSTENWIAAGSPIRNDEEVEAVLKICQECEPHFEPNADGDTGRCKVCGCEVNRMGGLVNKIRRATEHCPIGKW